MSDAVQETTRAAEVWRRLMRNKAAIVGGVIVCAFVLVALLASVIAPYPPNEGDLAQRLKPPSAEHWLGNDALGRDILSRVIYGAQVSLQIQVVAVLIALVLVTSPTTPISQ